MFGTKKYRTMAGINPVLQGDSRNGRGISEYRTSQYPLGYRRHCQVYQQNTATSAPFAQPWRNRSRPQNRRALVRGHRGTAAAVLWIAMSKHHSRAKQGPPCGADQDKARTIAKFLRNEGFDVLPQ